MSCAVCAKWVPSQNLIACRRARRNLMEAEGNLAWFERSSAMKVAKNGLQPSLTSIRETTKTLIIRASFRERILHKCKWRPSGFRTTKQQARLRCQQLVLAQN